MLHAVIMAGGSGTRFWPLSRAAEPKQFLRVFGPRSLIQQAYDRLAGLVADERVLVITNAAQAGLTRDHLPNLAADAVVAEPIGRDTAAAIGLGAALLLRRDPDAIMAVLSADQLIPQADQFRRGLAAAAAFVTENPDVLLTFGVPPTRPATGYGYLRRGARLRTEPVPIDAIRQFREKPSAQVAAEYLASGDYLWNAGIFVWKASTILEQLAQQVPATRAAVDRIAAAWDTPQRDRVFAAEYADLTKISIDFAVMEKAPHVATVEAPFSWDDVGSWSALPRVFAADGAGNVILGQHVGLDTTDCLVVGDDTHLIATLGVTELIVVRTADVTLVAAAEREQEVKHLLEHLKKSGRDDLL